MNKMIWIFVKTMRRSTPIFLQTAVQFGCLISTKILLSLMCHHCKNGAIQFIRNAESSCSIIVIISIVVIIINTGNICNRNISKLYKVKKTLEIQWWLLFFLIFLTLKKKTCNQIPTVSHCMCVVYICSLFSFFS